MTYYKLFESVDSVEDLSDSELKELCFELCKLLKMKPYRALIKEHFLATKIVLVPQSVASSPSQFGSRELQDLILEKMKSKHQKEVDSLVAAPSIANEVFNIDSIPTCRELSSWKPLS